MKNIIVYHNADLDGWMSATIVKYYLDDFNLNDVTFKGMNYGIEYQVGLDALMEDIKSNTEDFMIYMVDFTASDEFMEKYHKNIIWIDHHSSRINQGKAWENKLYKNYSRVFYPGRTENPKDPHSFISACELVWISLIDNKGNIPRSVTFAGRRDVWDLSDEVNNFTKGLNYQLKKDSIKNEKTIIELVESGYLMDYIVQDTDNGEEYDNLSELGKTFNEYDIVSNLDSALRTPVALIEYNNTDYYIAFTNRSIPPGFFSEEYLKKRPMVLVSIYFYLLNNTMMLSCKSLQNNQPALEIWKMIEKDTGIDKFRNSMGGHPSACGGNYKLDAILQLYTYLESHRVEFGHY